MLTLVDIDDLGSDLLKRLHEENVDTIEDDSDNISWLPDSSDLSDILLSDRLDGVLGLVQVRKGSLKLSVSDFSLTLDGSSLLFASLGDSIDLFGLDVCLSVLLIELLEKLVGGFSGSIEFSVLLF